MNVVKDDLTVLRFCEKSITLSFCLIVFQAAPALQTKLSVGSGAMRKVSFPGLVDILNVAYRDIGLLNFRILNISITQW